MIWVPKQQQISFSALNIQCFIILCSSVNARRKSVWERPFQAMECTAFCIHWHGIDCWILCIDSDRQPGWPIQTTFKSNRHADRSELFSLRSKKHFSGLTHNHLNTKISSNAPSLPNIRTQFAQLLVVPTIFDHLSSLKVIKCFC